jgi:subtilisin family serine protease
MKKTRLFLNVLLILSLTLSLGPAAFAQSGSSPRPAPDSVAALRLDEPVTVDASARTLSPELIGATGPRQVVVRLSGESAAQAAAARASAQVQADVAAAAAAQQDAFLSAVTGLDASAKVLARLTKVLNAVVVEVDGAALPALAAQPGVVSIKPVRDYELDLSETVPYIGATPAVQAAGFRGKDVKVAVLDSGIDYTHVAFGGPGTLAAYQAAYGTSTADPRNKTLDGLFPTARVVGGYDFVGEVWPAGPLAPDPDPIDCGTAGLTPPNTCAGGHGTHVADIIGGAQGVAPEVDLYAVKVCSAVSSACSGVALLQGMEFAVDPNGDGDLSDHVHIINMSLGAPYGQAYDDDLSAAVDAATSVGVLTVASAGNSADRPYIVGTPSATYTALSVAQTTVPSAKVYTIVVGSTTIGMIFQTWSAPLTSAITAPLFYDTTSTATRLGCTNAAGASPWTGTPLAGRIVLMDRGTCAVSMKVSNAAAAGAVVAIIANNVAGNVPPSFSFGGGTPSIPGFTITQAAGLTLRGLVGSSATIDPASAISIVGSMVGTSSRGPSMGQMFYGNQIMYGQLIKPEIGAPGASISAVAGTGLGIEPFGGTSGSAPMVSGAAALLMNATNWQLWPTELKSRLMNTAERNILNGAAIFGSGTPAPITRIGGGEVRVDRAIAANAAAWEFNNRGAALSFGFVDAFQKTTTLRRTVVVRNYGDHPITYDITPTFRFADDVANGAVSASAPASIRVPARSQRSFRITLTIDGEKLRAWTLNSGPQGGNGDLLTVFEYDGYLLLTDAHNPANNLSLPWHVLPRISNDVRGPGSVRLDHTGRGSINLRNQGVAPATVNIFSLIGTGPDIAAGGRGEQNPPIPLRAVGVRTFDGTGICPANTPIFQFALNTHSRQTHANYPAEFDIYFDTNRDGTVDYIGFTSEIGAFASSGQNAFFVGLATGTTFTARFFTDHILNSGNTVVTLCGSQIGLTGPTDTRLIDIDVYAFDNYFTGNLKSSVEDMTIAAFGERYLPAVDPLLIAPGATETLQVVRNPAGVNTPETGLLLLFTGSGAGAPSNNEARLVTVR